MTESSQNAINVDDSILEDERILLKDALCLEVRQLAIRIQKNGGVVIADRRVNGHVFKSCFESVVLIRWVMENLDLKRELAIKVAQELWQHGLIWNVGQPERPFEVEPERFFKVVHPYQINQLLLPSELEQLHRQMIGVHGPKLIDRVHNGARSILSCFKGQELLDWMISCFGFSMTRAKHVAQQLLDKEYFFQVTGNGDRETFLEGSLCQHKHDYCENLRLSKKRAERLLVLIQTKHDRTNIERENKLPLTIGFCVECLRREVKDCGELKARYILYQLRKHKRLEIVNGSGKTVDAANVLPGNRKAKIDLVSDNDSHVELIFNCSDKNNKESLVASMRQHTARFYNFASENLTNDDDDDEEEEDGELGDDQGNKLTLRRQINLRSALTPKDEQRRAHRLLTKLLKPSNHHLPHEDEEETPDYGTVVGRFLHGRKWVHLFMTVMFWIEILVFSESTLALKENIKIIAPGGNEFLEISSLNQVQDWLESCLMFKWHGDEYALSQNPRFMIVESNYAMVSVTANLECTETQKAMKQKIGKSHCNMVPDQEMVTSTKTIQLQRHSNESDMVQAMLSTLTSDASNAEMIHEVILEQVLLNFQTQTMISVKMVAKLGPEQNQVIVMTEKIPESTNLEFMHVMLILGAILIAVDYCAMTRVYGKSFTQTGVGLSILLRIILTIVGIVFFQRRKYMIMDYLLEEGNDGDSSFFDEEKSYRYRAIYRICLTTAMLLTSLDIVTLFSKPRNNIYSILKKTLGAVHKETRVLLFGFMFNFIGFAFAVFAVMNSLDEHFTTLMGTMMTLYGSLFGGNPYSAFFGSPSTTDLVSLVMGLVGFLVLASYLFFFIAIIMNLFVAILVGSYQLQKREEQEINIEKKRHMHMSGVDDIDIPTMIARFDREEENRLKIRHNRPLTSLDKQKTQLIFKSLRKIKEGGGSFFSSTSSSLLSTSSSLSNLFEDDVETNDDQDDSICQKLPARNHFVTANSASSKIIPI